MAVFLLKAKHGRPTRRRPARAVFADVPCPGTVRSLDRGARAEGITGGCGGGNYCPDNTVTRKQMAPFLLKTLYGSAHVPPSLHRRLHRRAVPGNVRATGSRSSTASGITGGCSVAPLQYCPDNPNTRAQMAVFLVKTFGLVW